MLRVLLSSFLREMLRDEVFSDCEPDKTQLESLGLLLRQSIDQNHHLVQALEKEREERRRTETTLQRMLETSEKSVTSRRQKQTVKVSRQTVRKNACS